jgi:hypothetical protein
VLGIAGVSHDFNIFNNDYNGVSVVLEFIVVILSVVVLTVVYVINDCNYVIVGYICVSNVCSGSNGDYYSEQFGSYCNTSDIYSGGAQMEF